jgi:hypothetical protein
MRDDYRGVMTRSVVARLFRVCVGIVLIWMSTVPASSGSDAAATSPHVVVVELFTSQGCSSCPPADRLLTKLGEETPAAVIPLAFHVDIWNHIGWTDPFSDRTWTERQVEYAKRFGLQQLSTPQAVVDGATQLVGSDERGLRAAIASAAARPVGGIALHVDPSASKVRVDAEVVLPEALRSRRLDLMLAIFETGLVTPVGRGENGGRTLQNDYVVRRLVRAAKLSPGGAERTKHTETLSIEGSWNRSHLGVAAFLQDPSSLEIRGASARTLNSASTVTGAANPTGR